MEPDKLTNILVTVFVASLTILTILFVGPGLGSHCLNETYCCNYASNTMSIYYLEYCTCPCDGKFDLFIDDPFYWFVWRPLRGYTLEDAVPTLGDPHQNDENYCGVYQATLNWNNVPYVVNFNVAEKVCTCTSKTLPSNSTWYFCERRT